MWTVQSCGIIISNQQIDGLIIRIFVIPMKTFQEILLQTGFSPEDLRILLSSEKLEMQQLFHQAHTLKMKFLGNKVFLRGLIEFSNVCSKDCLYCGIRKSNEKVIRYEALEEQILDACRFAWTSKFGSVVLQSGENSSASFVKRVNDLLKKINSITNNELGITLSCGEQNQETYTQWHENGAHRYLLRIETSNPELYRKLHPGGAFHSFQRRLQALNDLKSAGFQVGTGVMIGLPFQTTEDLVNDLLFIKNLDVDMVGMGPYIEHEQTPLYQYHKSLKPKGERLNLALKMVAILRLLMPDINIAATTALGAIGSTGQETALRSGANIVMPNLTPPGYKCHYQLYDYPDRIDDVEIFVKTLESTLELIDCRIGYSERGDAPHYLNRN
jgi:biotin synthase